MTISIGNIKDAEFSEQQKKNSPGYQAATGDLFKSNVTGGKTYANSINVLKGNNADIPGQRINEYGQVSDRPSEGNFRDQFPDKTKIDKYQDNNANLRSGEIILKTFLLINDKKNPKNLLTFAHKK